MVSFNKKEFNQYVEKELSKLGFNEIIKPECLENITENISNILQNYMGDVLAGDEPKQLYNQHYEKKILSFWNKNKNCIKSGKLELTLEKTRSLF